VSSWFRLARQSVSIARLGAVISVAGSPPATSCATINWRPSERSAGRRKVNTAEATQQRTEHWASFGLRDARMLAQGNLGLLTPHDVAREVVHAVTQPRHVLQDTIELQPAVPRRPGPT